MSDKIPEKILLYRLQTQHDPEAFAELYDFYAKRIYRFVFFKVSNHEEAEDITAEVFLKAWNYISEHKEVKSFSGLLYRVARNCIIDVYRARSAQPEVLSPDETDMDQGDGGKWYAGLNAQVDNQKIVQVLKKLKQEYQEVVTLRYVDELEIEEISAITGKGKIAVRVTLHRALKKLKELMGE